MGDRIIERLVLVDLRSGAGAKEMDWEAIPDQQCPGAWRVEAINYAGDGEIYIAIFAGSDARELAQEYAEWKNTTAEVAA